MENNLNKPKQVVILGGGASIKEGIQRGLWDKLQDKFTIGTNFSFNYFLSTIQTYVDYAFYEIGDYSFSQNQQKEHVNKLSTLPLIIGKKHDKLKKLDNTIMLQTNDVKYYRDIKLGIYNSCLVGIFALSLGIYLLDEGQIFLLGFDGDSSGKMINNKPETHFYNDIIHRGSGKVDWYYTEGNLEKNFKPFLQETKCHIYNVSLKSRINIFPKLSYSGFFEKLDKEIFSQEELRKEIRRKLL